jgi:cytoskeletal protein CcmA (bactofilin family)
MQLFTHSPPRERTEPPETNQPDSSVVPEPFNRTSVPTQSGALLSRGVSIKGSVKFLNELLIDGEVEGTIESTGTLTIGEHACIRGQIRTKSVEVQGTVEGNIFATERCELHAGSTLRGDIAAPRLVVNENVTFVGSAKVGMGCSLASETSISLTAENQKETSEREPNPALMRPVQPDDELAAIVGSQPLPRSELTKKLWNYIRTHGCQDQEKRTMINADDLLRPVFNGQSQVSMFEMTKLVSKHLR